MLKTLRTKHPFVLVVMDGAADRLRIDGRSPLAFARTPHLTAIARAGVTGLMTTLYEDLPQESLVAHLGMLGWDPHAYYPGGRASSELAAVHGVTLGTEDVVFRANLGRTDDGVLSSYSAHAIETHRAAGLARRVDEALREEFPGVELYHVNDYRTLLVVRTAHVVPSTITCAEPHESEGLAVHLDALVHTTHASSRPFTARVNGYLARAAALLADEPANCLLPWGLSTAFRLPSFASVNGFDGRAAIVGAMAFLAGIGAAGGLDFYSVGNGRPDSDFLQKGRAVVELLEAGYEFVCCHVNAPDEASHLHDPMLKVACLERIDAEIMGPVFEFLRSFPGEIGGLFVTPDHYSNSGAVDGGQRRSAIHSAEPVPFVMWNGRDSDGSTSFCEDTAARGRYGAAPINHRRLLDVLGLRAARGPKVDAVAVSGALA